MHSEDCNYTLDELHPERLGRFGHHPDPAIDFCVEVEELMGIATDRRLGVANLDDDTLESRVDLAMQFRVGGDRGAIDAKGELRAIDEWLRTGAKQ